MNLSKLWIVGWLVIGCFQSPTTADAHERKPHHSETEIVWQSDRLYTSWFGDVHRIRLDHNEVLAKWIVVKPEKNWDLNVDQITVKYLEPNKDHPVKKQFYPYERIRRGSHIRFELPGLMRVISVKVTTSGWSGSHLQDGFRIFLKKDTHRPPIGFIRTGYFYGQCIGGNKCPGYRRNHLKKFSIDLEEVKSIKKIQFYSHDNVGRSHNAKIDVYVDDKRVAHLLNMKSRGSQHTIELGNVFGRHITFETNPIYNDEAVIQRITVDYSDYLMEGRRKNHTRHKRHDRNENHKHRGHGMHGR